MLGFDNNKRRLALAAFGALVVHAWLISYSIQPTPTTPALLNAPLSVGLVIDARPPEAQKINEIEQPEPVIAEAVTQMEEINSAILTAQPMDALQPAATVRLQTSVVSSQFKSFLVEETKRETQGNKTEVINFGLTFESVYVPDESPSEISKEMLPKGSGQFITTINGKRLCGDKIVQLLSSDGLGSDTEGSFLTRECAPKQTFELNMNKPNNG